MGIATISFASAPFTSPRPDTPLIPVVNPIWTSDSFSVDRAELLNSQTDALLGGSPQLWLGSATDSAGKVGTTAGDLIAQTNGTFFAGFQVPFADYEVIVGVPALPVGTGATVYAEARRTSAAVTGTPSTYRAGLAATGVVTLFARGMSPNTRYTHPTPIAPGPNASIGVRTVGQVVSLLINGKVVFEESLTLLPGSGWAGVSGGTLTPGTRPVGSVLIRQIDTPSAL